MANDVEIRVKTTGASSAAGDIESVNKALDKTRTSADRAGGNLDRFGEGADSADTRAMGFRDSLTGVEDSFRGFNMITGKGSRETKRLEGEISRLEGAMDSTGGGTAEQAKQLENLESQLSIAKERTGGLFDGMLTLGMGIGDLGSGIFNFAVPAFQALQKGLLTSASTAISSAATHVTSAATTVAGWVLMGIQATINAAKMAAAWLISLGPIGLVIAAVAAVIAILLALGVGFDDIKRWAGIAWNFIKDGATKMKDWVGAKLSDIVNFFTAMPGRIASAASGMWNGITSAFKGAINAVIDAWNGLSFTLPKVKAFGVTVGGQTLSTPNIGHVATGGVRTGLRMVGERGRELVDLGASGGSVRSNADTERLLAGAGAGGSSLNVYVMGSVISERQLVQIIRDEAARGGFRGAF